MCSQTLFTVDVLQDPETRSTTWITVERGLARLFEWATEGDLANIRCMRARCSSLASTYTMLELRSGRLYWTWPGADTTVHREQLIVPDRSVGVIKQKFGKERSVCLPLRRLKYVWRDRISESLVEEFRRIADWRGFTKSELSYVIFDML